MKNLREILPKINQFQHKGSNGRIGVIGGCLEYTGAPFYSAISLLKGGADLAHIFCTQNAAVPIKSYSPEVIVHPYLFANEQIPYEIKQNVNPAIKQAYIEQEIQSTIKNMQAWHNALHAFVIGPGIGRDQYITQYIPEVIQRMDNGQIIVLDADGLWFLSHGNAEKMSQVVRQKSKDIILTPNQAEFERLWSTNFPNEKPHLSRQAKQELILKRDFLEKETTIIEVSVDDELVQDTVKLSKHFNCVNIIHKGVVDIITNGKIAYIVSQKGSMKRCGGIGDILTGLTSLYSYWGKVNLPENNQGCLLGCVLGSYITRYSSFKASEKYKFALTAPNIIEFVGESFNEFYFAKL